MSRRAALLAIITVAMAASLSVLRPPPASALTRCAKLDTPFMKARDIRTFGGLGCVPARVVVARYFANIALGGICRDDRFTDGGCAITRFDCATRRPSGGEGPLQGRCETLGGRRVVRFLEYDHLQARNPSGLTG